LIYTAPVHLLHSYYPPSSRLIMYVFFSRTVHYRCIPVGSLLPISHTHTHTLSLSLSHAHTLSLPRHFCPSPSFAPHPLLISSPPQSCYAQLYCNSFSPLSHRVYALSCSSFTAFSSHDVNAPTLMCVLVSPGLKIATNPHSP
jgi:hypothetical protein